MDFMRGMKDGSIDWVISDPPYGIGENSKKNSSRGNLAVSRDYGDGFWDKKLTKEYIDEILRVSQNQILWGGQYYADWLPASSCWLVWDKDNGANDFADCELAWCSSRSAVRKFKWRWNGMLKENPEERFHLTQKPIALMRWCVKNYVKEGNVVLDPFMGSGTTGVACVNLNRRFVGIEIDPTYYAIAEKRINNALAMQGKADLILAPNVTMKPLFAV